MLPFLIKAVLGEPSETKFILKHNRHLPQISWAKKEQVKEVVKCFSDLCVLCKYSCKQQLWGLALQGTKGQICGDFNMPVMTHIEFRVDMQKFS